MTVYEMRTYTLHVGKMGEAVKLYTEFGYPALQKGGQDKKLIGYFQADTGMINQLVHLWKFDDDADRRAHWASVFANKDFVEGFAVKFRPLLASQEVKLLTAAPWGPHPQAVHGRPVPPAGRRRRGHLVRAGARGPRAPGVADARHLRRDDRRHRPGAAADVGDRADRGNGRRRCSASSRSPTS